MREEIGQARHLTRDDILAAVAKFTEEPPKPSPNVIILHEEDYCFFLLQLAKLDKLKAAAQEVIPLALTPKYALSDIAMNRLCELVREIDVLCDVIEVSK